MRTTPVRSRQTKTDGGVFTYDVAVIGLGYVGLPLALLADERGSRVLGIDIDANRIDEIAKRASSVLSPEENRRLAKSAISASSDPRLLKDAAVIVIAVPTPVGDGHVPDLGPLKAAIQAAGANLSKDALVVVESTINPGVCEEIAIPLLEESSGMRAETDFYFAHCPERINPGDTKWTVGTIPRVVGAASEASLERALAFYNDLLDAELFPMRSLREAEAVKMVENAFRDVNIAFVNELAMSFAKLGIDITRVVQGAATKPFGFMPHFPGCGVGGHCIPVDPYYLISYAAQNGFTHTFLRAARDINEAMPAYTVSLALKMARERSIPADRLRVAVLGLAYKREIADTRESPAFGIINALSENGVRSVASYDPYVLERSTCASLADAVAAADIIIIATDHDAFQSISPELLSMHGVFGLVDGRNMLEKERFAQAGIAYAGIGR